MDLTTIIGLLVILSVASERLVEIIKSSIPWLNTKKIAAPNAAADDKEKMAKHEGWRHAALQLLAVGAGITTAFLARPAIPSEMIPDTFLAYLALGLLASGGSGFWNAVLTYILEVKDLKALEVDEGQRKKPKEKKSVTGRR